LDGQTPKVVSRLFRREAVRDRLLALEKAANPTTEPRRLEGVRACPRCRGELKHSADLGGPSGFHDDHGTWVAAGDLRALHIERGFWAALLGLLGI
jgi:hypothetical protein